MNLYEYQSEAINNIRKSFASGNKKVLFVLATAGGKTIIFSTIAKSAVEKGKKVLILAHRRKLLKQAGKNFQGFNVGYIYPGAPLIRHADIQIASVQTLARRLDKIKIDHFDLIIVDEGHHVISARYKKIIEHYEKSFVLLVTATPKRLDGKGLGQVASDMIQAPQVKWLMDNGYICPYRLIAPPSDFHKENVERNSSGYDQDSEDEEVFRSGIIGDSVENYRKYCDGEPGLAFCRSIKAAEATAKMFNDAGYKAVALSGKSSLEEQDAAMEALENGTLNLICSCDLIGEGYDVPIISVIIKLRITDSLIIDMQQNGRGFRKHPSKKIFTIIDQVGNYLNPELGLPCDHREWSLEYSKKKNKVANKTVQCDKCFQVFQKGKVVCSEKEGREDFKCPMDKVVDDSAIDDELEIIDGELVEINIDQEKNRRLEAEERRIRRQKQKEEEWAAKTLDDLKALEKRRGYNPGWAQYVFNSRKNKKG